MKTAAAAKAINPPVTFEHKRHSSDSPPLRPQRVQRYREHANIYKEEEEERSDRWKSFLERQEESAQFPINSLSAEGDNDALHTEAKGEEAADSLEKVVEGDEANAKMPGSDSFPEDAMEKEILSTTEKKSHRIQKWSEIRPLLCAIEDMMSVRVKKRGNLSKDDQTGRGKPLPPTDKSKSLKVTSEEDSFYDVEKLDPAQQSPSNDSVSAPDIDAAALESLSPWKEELEVLVRGGVPMALRGELWQAFVGVRARRVDKNYQDLLSSESNSGNNIEQHSSQSDDDSKSSVGPRRRPAATTKVDFRITDEHNEQTDTTIYRADYYG